MGWVHKQQTESYRLVFLIVGDPAILTKYFSLSVTTWSVLYGVRV